MRPRSISGSKSPEGTDVAAANMLYMIIEHFRGGDPLPVYRRFRDQGRLAPDGLWYVASWVTDDFRRCASLGLDSGHEPVLPGRFSSSGCRWFGI